MIDRVARFPLPFEVEIWTGHLHEEATPDQLGVRVISQGEPVGEVIGVEEGRFDVEKLRGIVASLAYSLATALTPLRRRDRKAATVDMLLFCPRCHTQHIDKPDEARGWDNPPHRTHECQACKHLWRHSDTFTNGVEAIKTKGEKDGDPRPSDEGRRQLASWADFLRTGVRRHESATAANIVAEAIDDVLQTSSFKPARFQTDRARITAAVDRAVQHTALDQTNRSTFEKLVDSVVSELMGVALPPPKEGEEPPSNPTSIGIDPAAILQFASAVERGFGGGDNATKVRSAIAGGLRDLVTTAHRVKTLKLGQMSEALSRFGLVLKDDTVLSSRLIRYLTASGPVCLLPASSKETSS